MSSFVYSGITFEIADDGMGGLHASNSRTARVLTMEYRVPWTQRKAAWEALLGGTTFQSGGGNKWLSRTLPHAYGEGDGHLYCTRADYRGEVAADPDGTAYADGTSTATFDYARFSCTYETLPFTLMDDGDLIGASGAGYPDEASLRRFITRLPPRSRTKVYDRGMFGTYVWGDRPDLSLTDRVVPRVAAYYTETNIVFGYVWHEIPLAHVPIVSILSTINKTNNAPFDLLYQPSGIGAGLLVFSDYSFEPVRLSDDTLAYNITFLMECKPNGVNSFPDPMRGGEFHPIVSADARGIVPYPSADFNALFRPV